MIAVAVELLTGRYVATAHDRRDRGEWPPHPARLYSAMVDAWGSAEEPSAAEEALLVAMESWGAPSIAASEAHPRAVVAHYVPVNDTSVVGLALQESGTRRIDAASAVLGDPRSTDRQRERATRDAEAARDVSAKARDVGRTNPENALELLPGRRGRQERRYPSMTPVDARVVYAWADVDPSPTERAVLDGLLDRVTRLGHSSSLVACRLADEPPSPRYVPRPGGPLRLRVAGSGQHAALTAAFAHHRASRPRSLPHRVVTYGRAEEAAPTVAVARSNLSGEMLVLERVSGPRLPIVAAHRVADALRGAVMAHATSQVAELTGHDDGGRPLQRPHVAFGALPFVGHERATGHIMGVAVVLPPGIDDEARAVVVDALARWRRAADDEPTLTLGRLGVLRLARVHDDAAPLALRSSTWSSPSRRWLSATPVALSRHPGALWGPRRDRRAFDRATATARLELGHVGLPEPADVTVSLAPLLPGSRDARDFPRFGQGGHRRALVHLAVELDEPVGGPLLLGAGRHLGLGLMRPARGRR